MHRALEATGTTNGIAPAPEWNSAQHAKTLRHAPENYEGVDDDADSNYDSSGDGRCQYLKALWIAKPVTSS